MRKLFLSLVMLSALGLFAVGCQSAEEAPAPANATSDIATENANPAPDADTSANATAEPAA